MGFGYVFLGYLVSFFLYMALDALGFAGLALLIGYGLMAGGLWMLGHYHKAFRLPLWSLLPLSVCAVHTLILSLSKTFGFDAGVLAGEGIKALFSWITFVSVLAFQLLLLYGIRMLAREVELKQIDIKAIRNAVFVLLYAALYLVAQLLPSDVAQSYLAIPLTLLQIVFCALNALLLLNCAKDICPAGEEEQPPKRYRLSILNRIGDTFEKNRQKAIDTTRCEAEERLAKRQASREKKKHKKKK